MAQIEDGDRDVQGRDERVHPHDEVTSGNPDHLSRATRTLLRIVALILVVSMTALFLRGVIHS